jgi:hypothetical protein
MFKTEVSGEEIEYALEERAHAEIAERHPDFIEWLCDRGEQMAQIIGRMMAQPNSLEALLRLSLMKNDYIAYRKYQADSVECEEIAGQLLDAEREGNYAD